MIDDGRDMNAQQLVAQVNSLSGQEFELVEMAREGTQGGAAFVRRPDGRSSVITYANPPIERMRLTAEVLDLAKARGLPVPVQEFFSELPDGRIVVVQERLPGNPIRQVDLPMVEALVETNNRFTGLLADRHDVPRQPLNLRHSGPDHPKHEALEGHDDRTRSMLARIRAIGESVPDELAGDDLVHPDFARGNILVDQDGQISGVVDWGSEAMRGDRAFALVSLRSDFEWRTYYGSSEWLPEPVVDRLDDILRTTIEPNILNACWAFWTLHKVYATICGGATKELEMWLRLGDSWLP